MNLIKIFEKASKRNSILLVLFIFSLVLRIGITFQDYKNNGLNDWADAKLYLAHGLSFANGEFYPKSANHPYMIVGPLLPVVVAISKVTFGDPVWPVLVLNCVLSASLVFVLFYLGRKILNDTAGIFLALWSIFNLSLIRLNFQVLKEPIVTFLIPFIILVLTKIPKSENKTTGVILSSILFSLLIHIDERFFIYTPLVFLVLIIAEKGAGRFKHAVLWLIILILTMIPWTIRNYHQFNELVILTPRTTAFTSVLWGTDFGKMHFLNDEIADQKSQKHYHNAMVAERLYGVKPRQYGGKEKYFKAFLHYWKPIFIGVTYIQYGFRPVKWSFSHNLSSFLFYGLYLPLYVMGFLLSILRRNWLVLSLALIPVIHSLLHTVMIWPLERYRLPTDFIIVLVSVWFISDSLKRRVANSSSSRIALSNDAITKHK